MFPCRLNSFKFAILLLTSICFFNGCSGSSSTATTGNQEAASTESGVVVAEAAASDALAEPSSTNATDSSVNTEGNTSSTNLSNNSNVNSTDAVALLTDPESEFDTVVTGTVEQENQASVSEASDQQPTITTTRVIFEIIVPAYKSNELQVELEWGDKVLPAARVMDELWTVEDDFPTDVANLLVVSFRDRNGDITLGTYENVFATGTVASQTFQITANAFVLSMWDSDSDGVSNFDELIAGTNPEAVQVIKEGLREFYEPYEFWGINPMRSLFRATGYYNSRIPSQRPYTEHSEFSLPYDRDNFEYDPEFHEFNWPLEVTHTIAIDIDESGTGSFSDTHRTWEPSKAHTTNQIATRTESEDAITWTGSFYEYDSSAHRGIDIQFSTETKVIDAQTRSQHGTVSRTTIGLPVAPIEISYTLTGTISDDNSFCLPDYGTITFTAEYKTKSGGNKPIFLETTIDKESDDLYWSVVDRTLDGDVVEEYLIPSVSEVFFYCDYLPNSSASLSNARQISFNIDTSLY